MRKFSRNFRQSRTCLFAGQQFATFTCQAVKLTLKCCKMLLARRQLKLAASECLVHALCDTDRSEHHAVHPILEPSARGLLRAVGQRSQGRQKWHEGRQSAVVQATALRTQSSALYAYRGAAALLLRGSLCRGLIQYYRSYAGACKHV